MVINAALICLALNVYHEARSEMITGQYAVALVTMNRAQNKKSKVCGQVFKPRQFSWTNDKVKKFSYGWAVDKSLKPRDKTAWKTALIVAKVTIEKRMPDFTWGSTHYHATYVKPYWVSSVKREKRIGRHIFIETTSHY